MKADSALDLRKIAWWGMLLLIGLGIHDLFDRRMIDVIQRTVG